MVGKIKTASLSEEDFMKKRNELFGNNQVEEISSDSGKEVASDGMDEDLTEKSIEDINKLLESVGIEPIDFKNTDSKSSEPKTTFTFASDIPDEAPEFNPTAKEEKKQRTIFEESLAEEISFISPKAKKEARKNLIENFRVLNSSEADSAIIEKNSTGSGAESIFDSVEVKKGENIFDAVERAGTEEKKLTEEEIKAAQKKARMAKRNNEIELARSIKQRLSKKGKKVRLKSIVMIVLFVVSLMLSILPLIAVKAKGLELVFSNGARIYTALNIFVLIASVLVNYDVIAKGLKAVKLAHFDVNACSIVLSFFTLLHSGAMLLTGMSEQTGFVNYTVCSVLALMSVNFAEYIKAISLSNDISILIRSKDLLGLNFIENKKEAAAVAPKLVKKGEPEVAYSSDAEIADDYDSRFSSVSSHERVYSYFGIVTIVAGFAFAFAASFMNKDAGMFASVLVAVICLCTPFMRNLISSLLKLKNDSTVSTGGVVVSGYDEAKKLGKANAVVVEADEMFNAMISKFRTVPGSRISRNDAVVFTAATLKKTSSILNNVFDEYLESVRINPPEAENLHYEEFLGYSCKVAGRQVLVGNRELLLKNRVIAPTEEEEKRYEATRNVMYLAVEGSIAATFVVSYNVSGETKNLLKSVNKSKTVLIIKSGDPCLNAGFVARKLSLPVSSVRIADEKTERITERCKKRDVEAQSGLIYSKAQKNIILLIHSAQNLYKAEKFAGLIQLGLTLLSFALLVVSFVLKSKVLFLPVVIVVIQIAMAVASYFIGSVKIKK